MDSPYSEKLNSFIFFASRGLGKSFLTAVFCCAKCILYPGIQIRCASASVNQAKIIFSKINELKEKYPILADEIAKINNQKDYARIMFKNGAVMETVVSGDGGRGQRCQILILDESRLMAKEDVQTNLMPFLTGKRTPPYLSNPKYKNAIDKEHNSILYLTSIGYKDEWSYKDFEQYAEYIANGRDDYSIISLPYQFGIEAKIIGEDYIEKQLLDNQTDMKIFSMEMEVIPYGESEHALFAYDILAKARKLRVPMIPITDIEYIKYRGDITKSMFYTKKEPGELRVVSFDIAVAKGRKNDNSVICVFRLIENGDYYDKSLSYIEVMNGVNLDNQILRLKQVFYDLECDYVVIDAGGPLGIAAVGVCGQKTFDVVRNVRYPGWKTYNMDIKYDERVSDPNAEPVMYCMQAVNNNKANMQYTMTTISQLEFDRSRLLLLSNENDAYIDLDERFNYLKLKTGNGNDREIANIMILPFVNTTKLVDEAIHTKMVKTPSGRFTFDEGSGRKDRITSMMYGLYFINILESDLELSKKTTDVSSYFQNKATKDITKKTNINPFSDRFSRIKGFGWRK